MRRVETGVRSSLWLDDRGTPIREYHDTGRMVTLPVRLDERGVQRLAHNRRATTLADRGADRADYRGADRPPPHLPPYLDRARRILLECDAVATVARRCGVLPTTAWSYVCELAATCDACREHARAHFVHPVLFEALPRVDARGSLREVMERVDARGDVEWRCATDRYAQLRLARVCGVHDGVHDGEAADEAADESSATTAGGGSRAPTSATRP